MNCATKRLWTPASVDTCVCGRLSVSLQSYFFFCLLLSQSLIPTKVLAYSINQHVLNSTLKVCVPVYTSLRPIWRKDSAIVPNNSPNAQSTRFSAARWSLGLPSSTEASQVNRSTCCGGMGRGVFLVVGWCSGSVRSVFWVLIVIILHLSKMRVAYWRAHLFHESLQDPSVPAKQRFYFSYFRLF